MLPFINIETGPPGDKKDRGSGSNLINLNLSGLLSSIQSLPNALKNALVISVILALSYFLVFKAYFYQSEVKQINDLRASTESINNKISLITSILMNYDIIIKSNESSTEILRLFEEVRSTQIQQILDYLRRTSRPDGTDQNIRILLEQFKSSNEYLERLEALYNKHSGESDKVLEAIESLKDQLEALKIEDALRGHTIPR